MGICLTARNIGSKHLQEVNMGRVKDWVIEMEEDAIWMQETEWCAKYGADLIQVFHDARREAWIESLELEDDDGETSDKSGD